MSIVWCGNGLNDGGNYSLRRQQVDARDVSAIRLELIPDTPRRSVPGSNVAEVYQGLVVIRDGRIAVAFGDVFLDGLEPKRIVNPATETDVAYYIHGHAGE